jgi:hypothetical protein
MPRSNSIRSHSVEGGWEEFGDDLVFHRSPVDSERLLVVFSARPIQPGKFHFFRLTELFPSWSKLLVRDPSRSWYNAGLPGIGATVEEIAAWLRDRVGEFGAERVVTTGPSMGGYAAILFGCMIGAERAIAVTPQTVLDPGLRFMMPPADLPLQIPDLVPAMNAAPGTKVDLVFGLGSPMDMFHAQRVKDVSSVRLHCVGDGGHELARDLNERGRLWPLLGQLLEGESPSWCDAGPDFDPELLPVLRRAIEAKGREDWRAGAEAGETLAAGCPGWPMARLIHDEMRSRERRPAVGA